jgi:hypothetical protein
MMDQRPATGIDTNVLMERVRRLFTLDTRVFEEVRMDRTATIPAIIVAAASTVLFAVGGLIWWMLQDYSGNVGTGEFFVKSVIFGSILGFVLWLAGVGVTYIMLSQFFRARVDLNELVRVMGFAAAPLALGLLLFVPEIGFAFSLCGVAMSAATGVIAAQTVTDAPAGKVIAAVGAGALLWTIILTLFGSDDLLAPGIFVFAPD